MDRRTWFCLLSLLLIAPSAHALCHWDPDTTPQPGFRECIGSYQETGGVDAQFWPRFPTDAEIESAKEEHLAWLQDQDTKTRVDDIKVVKYHTCNGNWTNQVEMRVEYAWWWVSTTGE
ncbi:MAG TPA: hypothetical protein PLI31_09840, partial [Methanoregulaceae archaeon]|nr:hypothetical protein [Methanoregulaceae archaeon]